MRRVGRGGWGNGGQRGLGKCGWVGEARGCVWTAVKQGGANVWPLVWSHSHAHMDALSAMVQQRAQRRTSPWISGKLCDRGPLHAPHLPHARQLSFLALTALPCLPARPPACPAQVFPNVKKPASQTTANGFSECSMQGLAVRPRQGDAGVLPTPRRTALRTALGAWPFARAWHALLDGSRRTPPACHSFVHMCGATSRPMRAPAQHEISLVMQCCSGG